MNVRALAVLPAGAEVTSGRFGGSEDVAAAVAFLACREASYINGEDHIVDDGLGLGHFQLAEV
ncbi:SDR family oxidoreductase [Actinomadura fulvescens]|uniref:Oxidoreductase n=1 Tax=Actinomadura fulvescens TaxID=46160 RepID=A0ABN3QNS4_9ACTN